MTYANLITDLLLIVLAKYTGKIRLSEIQCIITVASAVVLWPKPRTLIIEKAKIVSMIRKYHNHKPQTTPWHCEEEQLINHHETPGRQSKQSNQLSLPHLDDYNTRMDIK